MGNSCAWCGQESGPFVKHHYPIPKAAGGTETVGICALCHWKAHSSGCIIDVSECLNYKEEDEVISAKARGEFPLLDGVWPAGVKMILITPIWQWNISDEVLAYHKKMQDDLEQASLRMTGRIA